MPFFDFSFSYLNALNIKIPNPPQTIPRTTTIVIIVLKSIVYLSEREFSLKVFLTKNLFIAINTDRTIAHWKITVPKFSA